MDCHLGRCMLHALVLMLGYADMLLIMVYSLELAAAVIFGLCLGRVFFRRDAVAAGGFGSGKRTPLTSEVGMTPCCVE